MHHGDRPLQPHGAHSPAAHRATWGGHRTEPLPRTSPQTRQRLHSSRGSPHPNTGLLGSIPSAPEMDMGLGGLRVQCKATRFPSAQACSPCSEDSQPRSSGASPETLIGVLRGWGKRSRQQPWCRWRGQASDHGIRKLPAIHQTRQRRSGEYIGDFGEKPAKQRVEEKLYEDVGTRHVSASLRAQSSGSILSQRPWD